MLQQGMHGLEHRVYSGQVGFRQSPCVSCLSSLIQRVQRYEREPSIGPGTQKIFSPIFFFDFKFDPPYAAARHMWCGARASYPGHIAFRQSPCVPCLPSLIQGVERHTREPNIRPGTQNFFVIFLKRFRIGISVSNFESHYAQSPVTWKNFLDFFFII